MSADFAAADTLSYPHIHSLCRSVRQVPTASPATVQKQTNNQRHRLCTHNTSQTHPGGAEVARSLLKGSRHSSPKPPRARVAPTHLQQVCQLLIAPQQG